MKQTNIDDVMAQATQNKGDKKVENNTKKGKGEGKVERKSSADAMKEIKEVLDGAGGKPEDKLEEKKEEFVPIQVNDINTVRIPLDKLVPSTRNFFKPLPEGKFKALKESIKDVGLLTPIIVRPIDGTENYEILAGHNRTKALSELGSTEAVAQVVQADDNKAMEIIVDTNIVQRTEFTPMELAKAYQEKANAIGNRKGQRTDLQEGGEKGTTRDLTALAIADVTGKKVSGVTVDRYLKLNQLVDPLQEKVDNGEVSVKAGVVLAQMDSKIQDLVIKEVKDELPKVKEAQLKELKKVADEGKKITKEVIKEVLFAEKPVSDIFTFKIDIALADISDADIEFLKNIMDTKDVAGFLEVLAKHDELAGE